MDDARNPAAGDDVMWSPVEGGGLMPKIECLTPKDNDIIVIRTGERLADEHSARLRAQFGKIAQTRWPELRLMVLVLADGINIEQLPEEGMQKMGWVRAAPTKEGK